MCKSKVIYIAGMCNIYIACIASMFQRPFIKMNYQIIHFKFEIIEFKVNSLCFNFDKKYCIQYFILVRVYTQTMGFLPHYLTAQTSGITADICVTNSFTIHPLVEPHSYLPQ